MASTPHPLLPAGWNVPERFKERLGTIAGKQRAMAAEGHLLLILNELPDPESHQRSPRLFWRAPDGNWKSSTGGTGSRAYRSLANVRGEDRPARSAEEDARRAADYFELLQQIVPLHRTTRNLHITLQQAREAFPKDHELILFRDQAGELEREIELLHADVENGLNFTVAHQAEEQSRRANEMSVSAHRLNVLAAIFFPIGTVAAIFGMNLVHGYEEWCAPWTFWGVSAASLLIGFLLAAVIVRRPPPPPPPPPISGSHPSPSRDRVPARKKKR